MRFCWCTITVNNMEESLKFYQEILSLKVNRRFATGPVDIAFLGEGDTEVELIYEPSHKATNSDSGVTLGFEVKSLEDMMSFVKEKGYEVSGPFQPNPHVKFFYIKDPNGVKIQLVENM